MNLVSITVAIVTFLIYSVHADGAPKVSLSVMDVKLEPSLSIPRFKLANGEDFFGSPVEYPGLISSPFGPRWKRSEGRYDFHSGIDIFSPKQLEEGEGSTTSSSQQQVADLTVPIKSLAAGIVYRIYPEGNSVMPNSGNVVSIRHILPESVEFHGVRTNRLYSLYMHLDNFTTGLSEGQTVSKGQVLGMMGKTGSTDFVHLHLETRLGTQCSFPYQEANPTSSCSHYHFEPKINPLYFLPRFESTNQLDDDSGSESTAAVVAHSSQSFDSYGGTSNLTKEGVDPEVVFSEYVTRDSHPGQGQAMVTLLIPNRKMLSLNRIIVEREGYVEQQYSPSVQDHGIASSISLDFTLYSGLQPKNLTLLDSFDTSLAWGGLFPGEFTASTVSYNMSFSVDGMNFNQSEASSANSSSFPWTSWRGNITFVDIWGNGVKVVMPVGSDEQPLIPPTPTLHPLHNATFAKEDPKADICNAICSGLAICAGSGFILIFGAIVIKVYLAHRKAAEEQMKEHLRLRNKHIEQEQKEAMELELLKEKGCGDDGSGDDVHSGGKSATYSPPSAVNTAEPNISTTAVLAVRDPTTTSTTERGAPTQQHTIAAWNNSEVTPPPSYREPPAAVMRIEGMTPPPHHSDLSNQQDPSHDDQVERLPVISAMVARGNAGGLPVMSGGKTVIHQSQSFSAQSAATGTPTTTSMGFHDPARQQSTTSNFTSSSASQQQGLRSEATISSGPASPNDVVAASPVQSHAGVHFDDI